MNKKHIIITCSIVAILIITILLALLIIKPNINIFNTNRNTNLNETNEKSIDKSKEVNTTIDDRVSDNINEDSNMENNHVVKEEKTKTENKKENKTKTTYSCPKGYSLNGEKCIKKEKATEDCPSGSHSYSNGLVSGCIIFSEGYELVHKECNEGDVILKQLSLGQEAKNFCYPLHNKEPICPEGYTLDRITCISEIPATKN